MAYATLSEISKEAFEATLHSTYQMSVADERIVSAELVQYRLKINTPQQECFVMLFRVPDEVPAAQGSYRMQQADLGSHELFLVPIKRDAEGLYFEAVFNRLLS